MKRSLLFLTLMIFLTGGCASNPGEDARDLWPLFRFGPTYKVLLKECILEAPFYSKETAVWLTDHAALNENDPHRLPHDFQDFMRETLGNNQWIKENCE